MNAWRSIDSTAEQKETLNKIIKKTKRQKNAAALTFCYIQIEEVAIEDGLHHPGDDGDHVKESLKIEPPYPVDEVEGSVESQEEQVVGGDGLGLTSLADHEQLGQDGHRLQVDRERPQDLSKTKRACDCCLMEMYTEKHEHVCHMKGGVTVCF